jgi:beta-galactosidase
MKHAFQWISTDLAEPATGMTSIRNKYQFIALDGFEGEWSLTENGVEIQRGVFQVPRIPACRDGG